MITDGVYYSPSYDLQEFQLMGQNAESAIKEHNERIKDMVEKEKRVQIFSRPFSAKDLQENSHLVNEHHQNQLRKRQTGRGLETREVTCTKPIRQPIQRNRITFGSSSTASNWSFKLFLSCFSVQ